MTAFDNIKTNNWPATSNEFEDYLVLELPLNDAASLTESRRDIVVSDKVLHPKVALTNSSVVVGEAGDKWDASTTGSPFNGSWDVVFDGNAVANTNTQGASYWHYTYESTTSVTLKQAISGQIEILAGRPGSNDSGTHSITLQSGGSDVHTVTLGTNGASGYQWFDFGSRSNIDKFVITGGDPGVAIWAVRVDNVLLVNPEAGPKKHYDKNAVFNGSRRINTGGNLVFGTGDFTVECWAYPDSANGEEGVFQISADSVGLATTQTNTVTLQKNSGVWRAYANDTSTAFSTSVVAAQWVHLALVRSSGTMSLYVNGVADSTTISDSKNYTGKYINVGGYYDGNYLWTGAIQDLRVYNGVAKYTSNFTPPGAILG